jgi:uncharacterized membrane protein (UPF0127 family)
MKVTHTLTTIALILCSLGILLYQGGKSISSRTIPSLGEYVASSSEAFSQVVSSTTATYRFNAATTTAVQASTTSATTTDTANYSILQTPNSNFRILIASTSASRQQGLSGRISMAPDEGLLFIFPTAGDYGFWMKDMNFPIDIVWIDADRKVAGISENLLPESYPTNYFPPKNIVYVLELNAGAAQKAGLKTGSAVGF